MFRWERTELRVDIKAALIALALTAVFVLGDVVVAAHHDCQDGGDESCAVCLHAKAPSCLLEAPLPALPAPAIERRSVFQPKSRPSGRLLLANTTRGPPPEAL